MGKPRFGGLTVEFITRAWQNDPAYREQLTAAKARERAVQERTLRNLAAALGYDLVPTSRPDPTPLTMDERFAFEQAWDRRVDEGWARERGGADQPNT